KFYANARAGDRVPVQRVWSRHVIWGTHLLTGGIMVPTANAWADNIVWGTAKTLGSDGDNIVWGTAGEGDNIVWGTAAGDNIVWGTAGDGDNIVWGTSGSEIDARQFPADDAIEPPPSVLDQFGDTVGGL